MANYFNPDDLVQAYKSKAKVLTKSPDKIHCALHDAKLHYSIWECETLIYDNLMYPYVEAINIQNLKEFYPQYAQLTQAVKPQFFEFVEAGSECSQNSTKYYVFPINVKCGPDRVIIISDDLKSPSRLNSLMRLYLFIWGVKTQNAFLCADQSSDTGYVNWSTPVANQPLYGKAKIIKNYQDYFNSGFDEYANIVLREFSYDASNGNVTVRWTWIARFGPHGPPGEECTYYSQDDSDVIFLDDCAKWRYLREYYFPGQRKTSDGPGGNIFCKETTCNPCDCGCATSDLKDAYLANKCVLNDGCAKLINKKVNKSLCKDFHYLVIENNEVLYDNLLYPHVAAMTYENLRCFYPRFAHLTHCDTGFYKFEEAGAAGKNQVNVYYVVQVYDGCVHRTIIIGNDLRCPSRLVALERVLLFVYGIAAATPEVNAGQLAYETSYLYPPSGTNPTVSRPAIFLDYKGYVNSGYDQWARAAIKSFSYDATNQSVNVEWTWFAQFGNETQPYPGREYSQDDTVAILLDNCAYWRYIREYFDLNQLDSTYAPPGPKECDKCT